MLFKKWLMHVRNLYYISTGGTLAVLNYKVNDLHLPNYCRPSNFCTFSWCLQALNWSGFDSLEKDICLDLLKWILTAIHLRKLVNNQVHIPHTIIFRFKQ